MNDRNCKGERRNEIVMAALCCAVFACYGGPVEIAKSAPATDVATAMEGPTPIRVIAEALMLQEPVAEGTCTPATCQPVKNTVGHCVVGRRFQLVSEGAGGLAIGSHQVPVSGCEAVYVQPKFWRFVVDDVYYGGGQKQYQATGPHGTLYLTDYRPLPLQGLQEWAAVRLPNDDVYPAPPQAVETFFSDNVVNVNWPVSGDASHRVLVDVNKSVPQAELDDFAFPIKLNEEASDIVDSDTYLLTLESDLQVTHVLAQLRALNRVEAAVAVIQ